MITTKTTGTMALTLALMLGAAGTVLGQSATPDPQMRSGHGAPTTPGTGMSRGMMMDPQVMHEMMARGMMGPGMMQQMPQGTMGQDMGPGTMGQGMGPGMMGPGMMGQGMMGQGMMGQDMMGRGMAPGAGGFLGLEGARVVPTMQLSSDDVQVFFERRLAALGNERLKVGKVEIVDADTITAEVVTVDDSLVESFEVDRRTGLISKSS